MKRPELHRGDLVKRKKPHDDNTMFRVVMLTTRRSECRRLMPGKHVNSSEGFVDVRVVDKNGMQSMFKRRQLWRVPNQPRDKKPLLSSKVVWSGEPGIYRS